LIELLVVVAIIGILASLLLPALARAKGIARSTQCKSNLRQITLGLRMYEDDFSAYPHERLNPGEKGVGLKILLEPYLGSAWTNKVYCPTFVEYQLVDISSNISVAKTSKGTGDGYGVNAWGVSPSVQGPQLLGLAGGRSEAAIAVPSDMIALGDAYIEAAGGHIAPGRNALAINVHGEGFDNRFDETIFVRDRHRGFINISCVDGHVEAIKWQKLLLDKSDAVLRRWNSDHEPHRELLLY